MADDTARLTVAKTYKMYIDGKFPRTESGRTYPLSSPDGMFVANLCRASRKDFRNAVQAARGASAGWSSRAAYNRSQILYRVAEMTEGRAEQFAAEPVQTGAGRAEARQHVRKAIDRWVYYAGWADKYQQVFGSVNPVMSSHFNFSMPEPTGVVAAIIDGEAPLLDLAEVLAPVIVSGNTAVVLPNARAGAVAISFAEVLNSSDVPAGVVNILTGYEAELIEPIATHKDVNAVVYAGRTDEHYRLLRERAADSIKRIIRRDSAEAPSPYPILDCTETKTTWHPVAL